MRIRYVAAAFAIATTAQSQQPAARQPVPPQGTFAFVGATVLPMDSERTLANHTVIVSGGKIVALGPSATTAVPAGATRIDANGKFLMPGLAEMHSHVPNPDGALGRNVLLLYLANGITTMRGMQGSNAHVALRDQLSRGEVLGPRFFAAGPQLAPGSARTPDAGRIAVQRQKELGFDLLKIQEGLALDVYDTIAATAKSLRIPFAGHVPDAVGLFRALDAGQATIDHLDNYMETIQGAEFPSDRLALAANVGAADPTARRMAAAAVATKRAGAAVVPTMALWEMLYVTPESSVVAAMPELRYMPSFTIDGWYSTLRRGPRVPREQHAAWIAARHAILKALSDAGVPILLGTDSPQLFSVPGFSIHREMQSMAAAGMTPYQILRSGTWNVAEHLGLLDESGTVAVGKRADLILLEANPLLDVANAQKRAGVLVNGRWLPEAELQAILAGIAGEYAAGRDGPNALQ